MFTSMVMDDLSHENEVCYTCVSGAVLPLLKLFIKEVQLQVPLT